VTALPDGEGGDTMEAQMEPVQHIRILQHAYAAQLADATTRYGKAGILEQVTEERRAARLSSGAVKAAAKMGVTEPAAAFTTSAGLFGCADWTVAPDDDGFVATASRCLLCALVKQMAGPSPCRLFCLDPIEGMIVGLAPDAAVDVQETLYDGGACRVRVQARVREEMPAGN
jgi:hypothetical protein